MSGVQFNRERFKDAVLYIAWRTKNDPVFGRVKMAKTLWYSDLSTYAEDDGEALTGARYVHWDNGPVPPALYPIIEELESEGLARVEEIPGKGEKRLIPFGQEPAFDGLRPDHRYVIDRYVERMQEAGRAWIVSDGSHHHPGWDLTQDNEEIPYHIGAISRRKPTADDFQRADEIAVELGWK